METNQSSIRLCVVISGKRKSGKDYFVGHLTEILQLEKITYAIIHISEPIKAYFAEHCNLDLQELLSSSNYKEKYRREMIEWMETQIRLDKHVFARSALEQTLSKLDEHPNVIIVSDARRVPDVNFFTDLYKRQNCMLIRITAPSDVRIERGWIYTHGIDNVPSECGLDAYEDWNYVFQNSGVNGEMNTFLYDVVNELKTMLQN